MCIVRRIDRKSEEWVNFEVLYLSRHIKLFKSDKRTCAHVEVEGTGKTFVFIAKENVGDSSPLPPYEEGNFLDSLIMGMN